MIWSTGSAVLPGATPRLRAPSPPPRRAMAHRGSDRIAETWWSTVFVETDRRLAITELRRPSDNTSGSPLPGASGQVGGGVWMHVSREAQRETSRPHLPAQSMRRRRGPELIEIARASRCSPSSPYHASTPALAHTNSPAPSSSAPRPASRARSPAHRVLEYPLALLEGIDAP